MNTVNTLKNFLEDANEKYGDKTYIRYRKKDEIIDKTYRQLRTDSYAIGRFLNNAFGDKKLNVAVVGNSSYEYVACYFGVVCSQNVVVQLDAHMSPINMSKVMEKAEVDVVFYDKKLTQLMTYIKRKCSSISLFVCMNSEKEDDLNSLKNHIRYNIGELDCELDVEECCVLIEEVDAFGNVSEKKLNNKVLVENISLQEMKNTQDDIILCMLPIHNAESFCTNVLVTMKQGCIVCFGNSIVNVIDDIKRFRPTMLQINSNIAPGLLKNMQTDELIRKSLKFVYGVSEFINPKLEHEYGKYGIGVGRISPMNFVIEN